MIYSHILFQSLNLMSKCCDSSKETHFEEGNLEYFDEGEVWPYEIWVCKKCDKEYNVELIRDFDNKEER